MSSLSRLTSPLTPDAVIGAILGGRILRWSALSRFVEQARERLSFERALERVASSPDKVLVRVPLGPEGEMSRRYTLPGSSAVRLLGACDGGGAIQCVRATDPMLLALGEEIAEELGLPHANVTVGMFIAKAGHLTDAHNDDIPGINVQLAGTKTWSFSTALSAPNRPFESEAHLTTGSWEQRPERLDFEFDASPGDALVVPAGMWHAVRSHDDSVSILASVSFAGTRWVDALGETVRRLLVSSPLSRGPWLYGGCVSRERRLAEAEELLAHLRRGLAHLDVDALVPGGEPRSASRYRWNPAAWFRPTEDGRYRFGVAGFMVETGTCRLPERARAALDEIRRRGELSVEDLAPSVGGIGAAARLLESLARLQAVYPVVDESAECSHAAE